MAIQVVKAPNPAVGTDWSYVIPGQWRARLLGVTATLTTTAPPTIVADTSGNGRDANVNGSWPGTFQNPGPFAGGANNYAAQSTTLSSFAGSYCARRTNADMALNTAAMSVCYWARMDAINNTGANWGLVSQNTLATIQWEWDDFTGGGDPWDARYSLGSSGVFTVANIAVIGTWVHVAHTWDNVSWRTYVNGTLVDTHVGAGPGGAVTPNLDLFGSGKQSSCGIGAMAGIAIFNATLSGADVSAIAGASASAAAYTAAVNARTPVALWMMNETVSNASRDPVLEISNGTDLVGVFPLQFPVTNAGVFQWSWQVLGAGAQQSSDGQTTTVPIPDLTLPAGYSVKTYTPDLASTDQWSAVTLWFDDGTGAGPGYGFPAAQYLDAHYVYDLKAGVA